MKTVLYNLCLFNFFILFSITSNSQINSNNSLKADSLEKILVGQKEDSNKVNTLNNLTEILNEKENYTVAVKHAKQALVLSQKINYKKGQATAYDLLGLVYYNQSNYPEAIDNYLAAISLWEKLHYKRNLALSYLSIQAAYGMHGNYSENLKNAYAALQHFEVLGDKEKIGTCLSELANVYFSHNDSEQGLKNTLKALKIFKEINNRLGLARCYSLLGNHYLNQNNYDKALINTLAALNIYQDLQDIKLRKHLYNIYNTIGYIYELEGDFARKKEDSLTALSKFSAAESNYKVALKGFQEINYIDFLAVTYNYLGNLNIKQKKMSDASINLYKSLKLASTAGFKDAIRDSYESLANFDSLQGNYKLSYYHYRMYILYRDSIINQEILNENVKITMQHEFDKKQLVAKTEQEKKDTEANRIKNQQYLSITILVLFVMAVVIIAIIQFRNNKQKQRANNVLQQQKEKVERTLIELKSAQSQLIQSEKMSSLGELTAGIAHEIQNPLNFINNFSDVNSELIDELKSEMQSGNKEEALALADDIKDNEQKINLHGKRADAIVKGMLQHSRTSLGKKEPTNINALANEYLRLSYHGLRAKDKDFNANFITDFDESIGKIEVVPQDIGRVLLNLYNNAFYAVKPPNSLKGENYEPKVTVSTKRISTPLGAEGLEIRVKDNGPGIPQKVLDKIFQPFFTTKPTGQGTGLGLSLSYDIIKAHGGELKVKTKEGEGAEFIIQLRP